MQLTEPRSFLKHFNPAMAIIDPVQCNHDFVRQNCPFTYHVICA